MTGEPATPHPAAPHPAAQNPNAPNPDAPGSGTAAAATVPAPGEGGATRSPTAELALAQEHTEQLREQTREKLWKAVIEAVPIVATLATVMVAVFSSLQAQAQYRDSQASERFQSAVELLAGPDLTTRLGGIALLGQVAQTSPERRENVVRLLATYLRVRSPVTEEGRRAPVVMSPAAEEARAVFAALQYRGEVSGVDVGRVSARNLMLTGADLRGLVFSRSDLSGSEFTGSTFGPAFFRGATLRNVNFRKADLQGADFGEANLTGADFSEADLRGARLEGSVGLSAERLAGARTDSTTKLPAGIQVPATSTPAPATP